jgi:hypothetical protein
MKSIIHVAAIAIIAFCSTLLASQRYDARKPPDGDPDITMNLPVAATPVADSDPVAAFALPALETDKPRQVEFAIDVGALDTFTARERTDQYRDWLLYAAAATLEPSAARLNEIFFDLPTTRLPHLRAFGTFEYGVTRSRLLADGRVIALVPAEVKGKARKNLLGEIADAQQKNMGGSFDRLVVIDYRIDDKTTSAELTRRADIDYDTLYATDYGFHKRNISTLADLEEFMKSIDDLVSAAIVDGRLQLGGRKLLGRNYRAIRVEHVATLWQSEQWVRDRKRQLEAFVAREEQDFKEKFKGRTYSSQSELNAAKADAERQLAAAQTRIQAKQAELKPVPGSGFSLDPHYDFAQLAKWFDVLVAEFGTVVSIDKTELARVGDALKRNDIVPLLKLREAMQASSRASNTTGIVKVEDGEIEHAKQALKRKDIAPLLALLRRQIEDTDTALAVALVLLETASARQEARYDGYLQGTEVGMILFYTDLLAKLWTIDLADSSPRRNRIPDFVDDPSIRLSQIYAAESKRFRGARLWFGKSTDGYQLAAERNVILFARNATRIFSAGNDPTEPGKEVETSTFMAAAIDWWNDHYAEVAREEPEYERLNEVMKWSLVIGWLHSSSQNGALDFLDSVSVDRSMNFPAWVARHPELRFSAWDQVPVRVSRDAPESLPRLHGPVTAGGVSLATPKDVVHAPVASTVSPSARRSGRDYAKTDVQRPEALDGTRYELRNTSDARAELRTESRPAAKLRSLLSQLARLPVLRTIFAAKDRLSLETRVGSVPLGTLRVDAEGSALRISWQSRDLLVAERLARMLSEKGDARNALLDSPFVDKVVVAGKDSYARLADSGNWIQFSPETAPSVDIPAESLLRAGQPGAARSYLVRAVSAADVAAAQGSAARVHVSPADGGRILIEPRTDELPIAGATLLLTIGTSQVIAHLVDSTTTIGLSRHDDPGAAQNVALSALRVNADLHRQIVEALRRGETKLDVSDDAYSALQSALHGQDIQHNVAVLARQPARARAALEARLKRELDAVAEIHAKHGLGPALNRLDGLTARYGDLPQFHLRRTVLLVQARRYDRASDALAREKNLDELDQARWFEELSAQRVELDPRDHAELRRYFHLKQAFAARGDGRVFTRSNGTRLYVEVELTEPALSPPLSPADIGAIPMQTARFYATGEIGIGSTASGATLGRSLIGLVMGNHIDVRILPDERIGSHSPAAIHLPGGGAPPPPSDGGGKPPSPASVRYIPIGPHQLTPCTLPDEPREDESDCTVYLLTAQPPATPRGPSAP